MKSHVSFFFSTVVLLASVSERDNQPLYVDVGFPVIVAVAVAGVCVWWEVCGFYSFLHLYDIN